MKLYNTFSGGIMNKDLEVRLLPKNIYLDAQNIRVVSAGSQNSRSAKRPLGNTVVSSLSLGTNPVALGVTSDQLSNKIYWAVRSDEGSYICEYDTDNDSEEIVLSDTRGVSTRVLNFPENGYVDMRVLNDNDNGRNFLFVTDNVNEPLYFEIQEAKGLTDSFFNLINVSLIKAPPVSAPVLSLGNTSTDQENNIEAKFVSFAYRYKYPNGEYSALSPFSEFAFMPEDFSFNYGTATNQSMLNKYSKVDIEVNAGTGYITDIELIVKESGSNTAYIVESYNKVENGWTSNSLQTIEYSNSKTAKALEANQLSRIYDNVPTSAFALELIHNRVVFGNYTEGYDLVDSSGDFIYPSFQLDYNTATGTAGTAHNQVKSNRDYEIAIAYTDGKGRVTTPLTSDGNTVFVKNGDADKENSLEVTIASEAPAWATGYRFLIKQTRNDYDTIAPITFYRDGVNAWIKIEGNDRDKISEGDFIYVKSDTSGLKTETIRTKVLEVEDKERNFLENDVAIKEGVITMQQAGSYFKVEVKNFSLSEAAVTNFLGDTSYAFRSANTANNFENPTTYIDDIYYDGVDLNDLSDNSTYTGTDDIRYEIEINGTGGPDTFQWREFNVSTGVMGAYSSAVAITGSAQALSNGLEITFGSTTGHTLNDKWIIPCKSGTRVLDWNQGGAAETEGRRAIMLFQSKDTSDESIKAGASITLTYDDSSSGGNVQGVSGLVTESLSSSQDYPNLEEWFYGDNIISSMTYPADITSVMFRRGTLSKTDGQQMSITDENGRLYMAILSPSNYTGSGGSEVRVDTSIAIRELDNSIIMETIPLDENAEIFFELPRTYSVTGGNHQGNGGSDVNQVFGSTNAVINLEYFNSFGWYNGFESIKIGDTFNEKVMKLDTKGVTPIDNYKSIRRIASLTYSGNYEGTTQFNALNEFNLSEENFKDMDTKYGSIQKLHSKDTNLLVFQEDKTHYVLFSKSVLFNSDGTGNLTQSSKVLGQEVAYSGEYGIGTHPESFAYFGNRIYHLDSARGALMRLSVDGYSEISKKGMSDYFRTLDFQENHIGAYDPYNDEYLIGISDSTLGFMDGANGGFTSFYTFQPERMVGVNNRLYSLKNGQLWLHDSNSTRNNFYGTQQTFSVTTVYNDSPNEQKHWKSVNQESTIPFKVDLSTAVSTGDIESNEFILEENEYYGYIRQSQTTIGLDNPSDILKGIGNVEALSGNVVRVTVIPRRLSIGDVIYKHVSVSDTVTAIGTAIDINRDTSEITLNTSAGLLVGDYILLGKDARVNGDAIKGSYLIMTLSSPDSTDDELFSVKVEAVRSFD